MKIYTKTGDDGTTSLYYGERVLKDDARIECIGTIDELTSHLGRLKSHVIASESLKGSKQIQDEIVSIQKQLIIVMGMLAGCKTLTDALTPQDVLVLERYIDQYSQQIESFTGFVLPGANSMSAEADIARTIARKVERRLVKIEGVEDTVCCYINRLSDYIYSLARYLEQYNITIQQEMNLKFANTIINYVVEEAKSLQLSVVVAIVSKEGRPISVQSMDGAFIISYDLAIKKAFSATALKMSTAQIAQITSEGQPLHTLKESVTEELVTLGGGYPILSYGQLIGGIGVSGASVEEDDMLAKLGAKLIERG